LLPLAVINMVVLGIACWQAFEGRNIESAFSESRYIGYSVASLFQAFLTGLPISVIVKDDPRAFYLVLMLMIFVLSEGILLLIFLPKMIMASTFARMSLTEQRKEISAQIKKSTVDPTSSSRSYQERGSKFFRALAPVKNVIRKLPENHEPIPEAVNGVGSNPDDPSGISDESKTTTRDLPSAVPCDSRTTNSESTTGSSGNGKCLDGAIGADPPAPMEDPGTSMSSEIHASTQDAPACPSENGGAPRSTAVSELTIHA
jgi:competence protein ComGC